MKIKARLLEMAAEELLDMIPTSTYLKIKANDPHPTFKAFVIGHEGESTGKLAVDGVNFVKVVKKWYRSAIEKFNDTLKVGVKLFHGHNYDNNQEGRESIGEVVGKALRTIKDKLSVVMIGYIKPEYKNLPLDVASIEADINLNEHAGEYIADVDAIHGIALGNSSTETPGFAGATLLAQVQEFAEKLPSFNKKGKEMTVTIDEVKSFISAEDLSPMDLFPLGAITEVKEVKQLISDKEKDARTGEYYHRKRTDKKFDEEKEAWETEKKKLEDQLASMKPLAIQNKRDEAFATAAEARKLSDQEQAFIKRNLPKFNPEDVESIPRELDKFLDNQLDEFKVISKDVFNIEQKEEKKAGAGSPQGKNQASPLGGEDVIPSI